MTWSNVNNSAESLTILPMLVPVLFIPSHQAARVSQKPPQTVTQILVPNIYMFRIDIHAFPVTGLIVNVATV